MTEKELHKAKQLATWYMLISCPKGCNTVYVQLLFIQKVLYWKALFYVLSHASRKIAGSSPDEVDYFKST
jgi:hypothetical protein